MSWKVAARASGTWNGLEMKQDCGPRSPSYEAEKVGGL